MERRAVDIAWIESHQTLGNHPKTKKFARLLGVSKVTAVGHLHYLWWWALDFAQDGNLLRYDAEEVASAAEWEGDAGLFWSALADAGFVDHDGKLNDWYDYAGRLIERRKADADRKRESRVRDVQGMSDGRPRDGVRNRTLTVPINDISPETPPEADEPSESPDFDSDFWGRYPKGRGAKKVARAQWDRMKPDERQAAVDALPAWVASPAWHDVTYVVYAERWLRDRKFQDPPPAGARASPNGRQTQADLNRGGTGKLVT